MLGLSATGHRTSMLFKSIGRNQSAYNKDPIGEFVCIEF